MSFFAEGIKLLEYQRCGPQVVLTVSNSNPDTYLQCYISGKLFSCQNKLSTTWRAALPVIRAVDTVGFLAVNKDSRSVDYWSDAFGEFSTGRVQVQLTANMTGRYPGDKFNIFLSPAGRPLELLHSELVHDNDSSSGFGMCFDYAFGFDSVGAPGFSSCFGDGEFGFDCQKIEFASEPLPSGDYDLQVSISNAFGNHTVIAAQTLSIEDEFVNAASDISFAEVDEVNQTLSFNIVR